MREDDPLYVLKSEEVLEQLDIKVGHLDTASFGSFCQDNLDITKVITVHANCCPSIKAKIEDLTAMLDVDSELISKEQKLIFKMFPYRAFVAEGLSFSKEQLFMSAGYIDLVRQKILILGQILEHGYNYFIFELNSKSRIICDLTLLLLL
ncbi:hypothetical protein GW17_00014721 [Ensete ventricosum]|nr:hypothetical protein GW17_00014721 [Ensete ventricosum]